MVDNGTSQQRSHAHEHGVPAVARSTAACDAAAMKLISTGFLVLVTTAALGCGGSDKKPSIPAQPAGPTCADVAANTEKQLLAASGGQELGDDVRQLVNMARDTINERCPADGWSQEAIACLATATGESMEDCSKLLTDEQNRKLEETMKQKMQDHGVGEGGAGEMEKQAPSGSAPPDDPCGGDE